MFRPAGLALILMDRRDELPPPRSLGAVCKEQKHVYEQSYNHPPHNR